VKYTPTARQEQLIVRELEDETLVYDLVRDEAHCLNQTAALVWKHCDGRKTGAQIAALLDNQLKAAQSTARTSVGSRVVEQFESLQVAEEVVWMALAQLRRKRLLTERMPRASTATRISRREMAHRLAQAMAIALPLVTTIAAPRPASAASCSPTCDDPLGTDCCPSGCPCSRSAACCNGLCSGGQCN
jgi:hypothetical protein